MKENALAASGRKIHKIYCVDFIRVAEPHNFYAASAPAPGKNFDAAPAPAAPVHTLLYHKTKFLKRTKV
jgi:hypothetical protein